MKYIGLDDNVLIQKMATAALEVQFNIGRAVIPVTFFGSVLQASFHNGEVVYSMAPSQVLLGA
jgi:hypothetical protein